MEQDNILSEGTEPIHLLSTALLAELSSPYPIGDSLERTGYSAPMWVPFSATERRMSRIENTSTTPTAAETVKTSK